MNEQLITRLAEQAGLESFYAEYSPWQVEFEKFAELIVRECALVPNWCVETGKDLPVEMHMAERTSKMIKEYFGVEE
jgi:hypothetical protein